MQFLESLLLNFSKCMKKIVLVLGLGVSGRAAVEFLLKKGEIVLGIDGNPSTLNSKEISHLVTMGLSVQTDKEPIHWNQVSYLIVSPGVSQHHPIYVGARNNSIEILGEAELALPQFDKPLVAITGTNGKTTVALLTEHILNSCGIKAKAVGNIGSALCNELIHPGDEEVFVVELSSYQLETMKTKVFEAGVLLNITPDHLDRYCSMEEYAKAKCQLQNVMKEGALFYVQSQVLAEFGHLLTLKNYQTLEVNETIESLSPLQYTKMGKHDWENFSAAWALCQRFSISWQAFCNGFLSFKKPPHRIEFVRQIAGVSYYDDSKGTNIDAVIQAVNRMQGPVILIAGGVDKGASYLQWKESFSDKVKQIIAIGEAAPKIYEELNPYFNVKLAETLPAAVRSAADDAKNGDFVLLSPGCASFDMFTGYAHRGEEFQRCVKLL